MLVLFPEGLRRLYRAGEENLGAEAGLSARGSAHKDEEVAVDAE